MLVSASVPCRRSWGCWHAPRRIRIPLSQLVLPSSIHFSRFIIETFTMFNWQSEKIVAFTRVPGSDESEELLGESERPYVDSTRGPPSRTSLWIIVIIILTVTAITSAVIGAWADRMLLIDPNRYSVQHISQFCMVQLLLCMNWILD